KTPEGTGGRVGWRKITPDYFSVLRIPLLRGRYFNEQDRYSKSRVYILSDRLAHRLFGNKDPIGSHVRLGDAKEWATIIGIVADVKNNPSLTDTDDPEWYSPLNHDA